MYVNWDEGMRDPATGDYALARNTSLIEDLGKVDYIFSDKTGTLTSNEMQLGRSRSRTRCTEGRVQAGGVAEGRK